MENTNETVNQETKEVKTFTQDEVNNIVNDRLARERKKYEGIDLEALKTKAAEFDRMEEANKSELEKANDRANKLAVELENIKKAEDVREIRQKVSDETGVPMNLLTATTEDECTEQANAIKAFAVPSGYPSVKDAGEPQTMSKQSARDDFSAWANAVNS